MKIIYHEHSGFSVELDGLTLLFDYIGGGFQKPSCKTIAFISHEHGDHCSPSVYSLADEVVRGMKEGECRELFGARIKAYGSTDEGVSFLVNYKDNAIFHAGDLNFWHWKNESDAKYVKKALADYSRILDTLDGVKMDVAFFPIDPRMGSGYEEGAELFMDRIKPTLMIPMHFRGKADAAEKFALSHKNVKALTKQGESLEL